MKHLDDDESLERELFALRAEALPSPALDIDDVFARAERRPRPACSLAWTSGAVAAAAAMFLAVVNGGDLSHADDVHAQATEPGDAPACRADDGAPLFSYEVTLCVARP